MALALTAFASLVLASAVTKVIGVVLFILLVSASLFFVYTVDRSRRARRANRTAGE